jgi:hypothetical protein
VVSSRWLFKIKHTADGSIEKYKERFVARGFSQKEGIDHSLLWPDTRRFIALAAKMKWKTDGRKDSFLNRVIEEEVYIEQPQGFEG